MAQLLLTVDPSLTCTGWALFEIPAGHLRGVGKLKCLPPKFRLDQRYLDLQNKANRLLAELELGHNDVMICEEQTTMRDPKAAFKVERVRGIFEAMGRQFGLEVPGRINPRTVQVEVLGLRGPQLARKEVKDIASRVAYNLFASDLTKLNFNPALDHLKKHQDIVDALLLGAVALGRIREAKLGGQRLGEYFS